MMGNGHGKNGHGKKRAAFFSNDPARLARVYGAGRRERIEELTDLYPVIINSENFSAHREDLSELEVLFSTWGMPVLDREQVSGLPSLKAVFYGAGTVQYFARPFLENGVTVMSAWGANAVPVAEFTLAQILLSTKGYFRNIRDSRIPEKRIAKDVFTGNGNFGETVSIIGCGMVGRKVIELVKPFNLKVLVADPYMSPEQAQGLGVEKCSIGEAFSRGYVVSNHAPDIQATKKLIGGNELRLMREDAVFINTGRGATVDEEALIAFLHSRPSVTALLDVTWPEPPRPDSPLYTLPNVYLTSHIAGSLGDEVVRMADYCIEEFLAWEQGRPLKYAVTAEMLTTMA